METKKCTQCGQPVDAGAKFCSNCGAKVDVTASTGLTTPPPLPNESLKGEPEATSSVNHSVAPDAKPASDNTQNIDSAKADEHTQLVDQAKEADHTQLIVQASDHTQLVDQDTTAAANGSDEVAKTPPMPLGEGRLSVDDPDEEEAPMEDVAPKKSRKGALWVVIGVLVAALIGAGAWWLSNRKHSKLADTSTDDSETAVDTFDNTPEYPEMEMIAIEDFDDEEPEEEYDPGTEAPSVSGMCEIPSPTSKPTKVVRADEGNKDKKQADEGKEGTELIIVQKAPTNNARPNSDQPLNIALVEQKPSFPGGDAAMYKWLSENISYPAEASEAGISGRVTVQFIVEKDGSLTNIKVVRGKHHTLDAEARRVVRKMPRWTPGKNNGQPIRVTYNLPIAFTLH